MVYQLKLVHLFSCMESSKHILLVNVLMATYKVHYKQFCN